jgi:hypothetical protein
VVGVSRKAGAEDGVGADAEALAVRGAAGPGVAEPDPLDGTEGTAPAPPLQLDEATVPLGSDGAEEANALAAAGGGVADSEGDGGASALAP